MLITRPARNETHARRGRRAWRSGPNVLVRTAARAHAVADGCDEK